SGQHLFILAVEFITMPVAFRNLSLPINPRRQSVRFNLARPRAEPHRASKFLYSTQLAQLINHTMVRRRIEFARIRLRQPAYISRELNARGLHPQAYAEIWNFIFPCIADRLQHALYPAFAKAARHKDPIEFAELFPARLLSRF